jgi:hypothetical protein
MRRIVAPVAPTPVAAPVPAAAVSAVSAAVPLSAVSAVPAVPLSAVEVVVVVDIDFVVAPAAAAPHSAPEGAHRDAEAKREERSAVRVVGVVDRRIRVDGRTVDDDGVVGRDIDDVGARGLDDDDFLLLDDLRLDRLLLARRQSSLVLGLLAHPLNRIHDVGLLSEEGVSEIVRPLNVVAEPLDHVGEGGHRLDGGVPRLPGDRVREGLVLEIRVLRHPLLKLDDLERISRRRQRLREQRVGVERDGCDQRVELVGRERLLRRRGRRFLREKGRIPQCDQTRAGERHDPPE